MKIENFPLACGQGQVIDLMRSQIPKSGGEGT